ncbi:hypothetical protein BHE74_00057394 [Ensete ventricosum]|nr:hypothetical protein GW17_00008635 [Ensete ventricosum]RWW37477.1 hypothetical protein BHE74_00057394 [Ensete ventricosum]
MVPQMQVFRVCASKLASDERLGHQHMGAVYHRGRSQIVSTSESHGGDLIIQRYDRAVGELDCFSAHIHLREPDKSKDKAKRRLPLPTNSHPAKGRPPLWSAPLTLLAAAPCGRPVADPLLQVPRCKRVCPRAAATPTGWPQPVVLAGGYRPYRLAVASRAHKRRPYERRGPPLRVAASTSGAGLPCRLALAVADHPLVGDLCRGLAVGGRPCMGAGRGWPPLLAALQKCNKNA